MKRFCDVIEMSRATFYRRRGGKKHPRASRRRRPPAQVITAMRQTALSRPVWGYRRVWAWLWRHGCQLSDWQVRRTLKEEGLALPSNWTQHVRERTLAQREYLHKPQAVNELWQLDCTPLWLEGYGRYQAINVVDYYSRYILVSVLSPQQRAVDLIAVLEAALHEARSLHELDGERKIVLVTDNGPALQSRLFAQFIEHSPFRHVRGREHHPQTIGMVERFHESVKYEEVYLNDYRDPVEAAQALARYRWHYNWERPHQALDYGVPGEIYCARTKENTKLLEAQKCLT